MEAFAAQMDHVDYQIGRVVKELERIGELDNTLIFITCLWMKKRIKVLLYFESHDYRLLRIGLFS